MGGEEISLENKIFNATSLLSGFVGIISSLLKFCVGATPLAIIAPSISSAIFFLIYFSSRFRGNFEQHLWLYITSIFAVLSLMWFLDGGITGPLPYVYFLFIIILTITLRKAKRWLLLLVFLNILIISIVEYFYPNLVWFHKTRLEHFIDLYFSMVVIFIFGSILISILMKQYNWERIKTERSNIKLQDKNRIIEKKNIELDKLNKTKDKFFSIIGHDLKNPFVGLINITDILINRFDKFNQEEKKEYLQLINKSSERVYKLLENLLEWAKIQKGNIRCNPTKIDLQNSINNIVSLHEHQSNNKNISIICDVPKNTFAHGDENMVNTILRNLISNAIKFTPINGNIIISAKRRNEEIEVMVSDNGIGIRKETIKKLFRIDHKQESLGTNGETGTGLGLILSKEFIEKNNGKIWVESEIDRGSNFIFTLPIARN